MKEKFMTMNEVTRQHVISLIDTNEVYEVTIKKVSENSVRTNKQNASIHVYCDMLRQEYDAKDLGMAVVLEQQMTVPWTMDRIKDLHWRTIQVAMGFDKSTTKLQPAQVGEVYKRLNKHTYDNFDIDIAFPCEESMRRKAIYGFT